jgi:hypothetical protein
VFGQCLVFHIFEVAKVEKSYFTLKTCTFPIILSYHFHEIAKNYHKRKSLVPVHLSHQYGSWVYGFHIFQKYPNVGGNCCVFNEILCNSMFVWVKLVNFTWIMDWWWRWNNEKYCGDGGQEWGLEHIMELAVAMEGRFNEIESLKRQSCKTKKSHVSKEKSFFYY